MSKKKTARAVQPNIGVERAYKKELERLVSEMSKSTEYWIEAAYKANPPRMEEAEIAEDARVGTKSKLAQEWTSLRSPSARMRKPMKELADRWIARFDEMSVNIATKFAVSGMKHTDAAFKSALKDAGWTVDFKVTPVMRDAMNATIQENVALIRSIPEQYFLEINGIVNRGFTAGRDLHYISQELQKRYGVTSRRAALIARDQSNKLNATVTQARRVDLGLFEAQWLHSGAGKHPRPSHLKAGRDKLKFDIRQGAYLDGKWVLPGQEINCHPGNSEVNVAHGCMKLYRRRYSGELVTLIADDGVILKATPNHPVLTDKGWKAAQFIDLSDYLVSGSYQGLNVTNADVQNPVAKFDEFFDAALRLFNSHAASPVDSVLHFHGDVSNGSVDVVDIARYLSSCVQSGMDENLVKLILAFSDSALDVLPCDRSSDEFIVATLLSSERGVGGFGALLSKLRAETLGAFKVGTAATPNFDALLNEASSDGWSGYPMFLSKLKLAKSGHIGECNLLIRQLLALLAVGASGDDEPMSAESLGESSSRNAESLRKYGDIGSSSNSFKRVREVFRSEDGTGHVFNLETKNNWYVVNGIITHNCRCSSKTILPF